MTMIFDGQPFTAADARAVGIRRSDLDGLRRLEAVRPVMHGVYIDAAMPDDLGTRALAVARVLPRDAVICRRTAAWLYGVDVREPGRHRQIPQLDVAVPVGQPPVRRFGVHGVVQELHDLDVCVVSGVPVTTPLRTAVDLARWLPRRSALACLDALLHLGLISQAELIAEVERFSRYPYIEQARDLAHLTEPKTESFGESWLRLRIIDSGFPKLEPQIEIRVGGSLVFRIDLGSREEGRCRVRRGGRSLHRG